MRIMTFPEKPNSLSRKSKFPVLIIKDRIRVAMYAMTGLLLKAETQQPTEQKMPAMKKHAR